MLRAEPSCFYRASPYVLWALGKKFGIGISTQLKVAYNADSVWSGAWNCRGGRGSDGKGKMAAKELKVGKRGSIIIPAEISGRAAGSPPVLLTWIVYGLHAPEKDDLITNPTIADPICGRLIHSAYRISLIAASA